MAQFSFDTLAFVKRLSAAGMDLQQAEALAEALHENAFEALATKDDLNALGADLRSEMKDLELRLTNTLTARFGAAMAASTALIVTILGVPITLQ